MKLLNFKNLLKIIVSPVGVIIFFVSYYSYYHLKYDGVVLKAKGQLVDFVVMKGRHSTKMNYHRLKLKIDNDLESFDASFYDTSETYFLHRYRGVIELHYEQETWGIVRIHKIVTPRRTFVRSPAK